MTPAQQHRARKMAEVAARAAAGDQPVGAAGASSEYALQRARLGVDLRRLHEIQSIERKIELKRELLPAYMDWVEGVLTADTGAADDIVVHVMIWLIDIEAMFSAMRIVRYVLKHRLDLPERFNRSAPTYICEEIAESALKRLGREDLLAGDDAANMVRLLDEIAELVADEDIFDQVRAKLEKAQGLAALALVAATPVDADGPAGALGAAQERAIAHLGRALELNPKAGVKQSLDRLKRERAKAVAPESDPA